MDLQESIDRFCSPLTGLLVSWGVPAFDAAELAQDSLADAHLSLASCRGDVDDPLVFGRWLRGTAKNKFRAWSRSRLRRQRLAASAEPESLVRWGIWGWPEFDTGLTVGAQLSHYRSGKFRDVSDGLSNTIAVVERSGKPVFLVNGKPNPTPNNPNADYPGQVGWSSSNIFSWSINKNGIGVNESNAWGIYSFHPGGANVGMADGSVRFLSDSTDFETLVRLYGRSDGGLPE